MKYLKHELENFERNVGFFMSRLLNEPLVPPLMLQLHITKKCPLNCRMCDIRDRRLSDEMSFEEIKEIINQTSVMGIKCLFLIGGEPLLRKDLFDILDYATKKGLATFFNTCGVLIDEILARKIVESSLTYLTFSLDGATAKTHDFFRGECVFDRSVKGLNLIQKFKIELNSPTPELGISSIIANQNLEELMDLIRFAEKNNLGGISFQPIQTSYSKMAEKNSSSELWIPKERLPLLDKVMDEIRDYKQKTNIKINCDVELIKKYFRRNILKGAMSCYYTFTHPIITQDGFMSSCFSYIGDVKKDKIKKIWKSSEFKKIRIKAKNCNSLCVQYFSLFPEAENLYFASKDILDFVQFDNEKLISKKCLNILNRYGTIANSAKKQISFFKKHNQSDEDDLIEIDDVIMELESLKQRFNTLGKTHSLEFVNIDVTSRCNLRCKMCFDQEKKIIEEMNLDDLKKLIFSAIILGAKRINLSGGEPFLRNDLLDLLYYIDRFDIDKSVVTNGLLLNEEIIRKLVNLKSLAIVFSLDALTPELHDTIRSQDGAFRKTVNAIKLFKKVKEEKKINNVKIYVSTVIVEDNLNELLDLTTFVKNLGVDGIYFQPLSNCHGVYKKGIKKILDKNLNVKRLWVKNDSLLNMTIEKLIRYKKEYDFICNREWILDLYRKYYKINSLQELGLSCITGEDSCFVNSEGKIKPCATIDWSIGNIKKDSLIYLWNSNKFDKLRNEMKRCTLPCLLNCYKYEKTDN